MGVLVLNPGLQTTLQSDPRIGLRHKGVPLSGAADLLSLAVANRLVGNTLGATALEITLSGARFQFERACQISITGASVKLTRNSKSVQTMTMVSVQHGDVLTIEPPTQGCRAYLGVSGGIQGRPWLGSVSTYLPAGLGGYKGRALKKGDRLRLSSQCNISEERPVLSVPTSLHSYIGRSWMLRAVPGPDMDLLTTPSQTAFFDTPFQLSHRASRMGAELEGQKLNLTSDGRLPSAAVFPGTIQCPPSGQPFLLMADAQTTGGYPRIASVIRADRHMLGQIRPGDRVQFRRCTPDEAANVLREKTKLLQIWLGNAFQLR